VIVGGSRFPAREIVIFVVPHSFLTSQGKINGSELCKNVEAWFSMHNQIPDM
jgi:hypothetical protein